MSSPNFESWIEDSVNAIRPKIIEKVVNINKNVFNQLSKETTHTHTFAIQSVPIGLTTYKSGTSTVNLFDLYAILGDAQRKEYSIEDIPRLLKENNEAFKARVSPVFVFHTTTNVTHCYLLDLKEVDKCPQIETIVDSVSLQAGSTIKDLFDWDYDVNIKGYSTDWLPIRGFGPMAKAGAAIQAAHGTIGGAGGMVFNNYYQLDSNRKYFIKPIRVKE